MYILARATGMATWPPGPPFPFGNSREFPGIAHPQIPGGNSREFRGKLIFRPFPRNFVQNAA